jgi:mannan endo-1,4-beta-mannosidase
MIDDWQRAKNGLRNTGLGVLVFALPFAPAAVSAADDPSATSFIKTSGTNLSQHLLSRVRVWSAQPAPG